MSFRRGQLDVYIPVLGVVACILLPIWLGTTFQAWRDMDRAQPLPGRVTGISDRSPYAAKKDSDSLEYPIVEYVDHQGFTRHLNPYSGALPGYFHIGQNVTVGRIGTDYFILDRWYVWQEHIVIVPLCGIWILAAVGYYLFWRPRMIAKEKKESNQPPEPMPLARHGSS